MNKRKSWIFTVFVLLIMAGVILTLIFWPKDKDNDALNNNNDEITKEENGEDENPEEPAEIYATSLIVNLPSTINLLKDTKAEFLSGYVAVLPNEAYEKLKIEIVPRYNSSAFGIEFSNSILIAKLVGSYNMIISVPKTATSNFSKTILIIVYEEEINAHVSQVSDHLTVQDVTDINDMFEIKNTNFSVFVDDKINYTSNNLVAIKAGESSIKFDFIESYVKYIYEFKILVKDIPQYSFVFNNVTNNIIEIDTSKSSVFFLNYYIIDRKEGDVPQLVITSMQDETVAYVEDIANPLIKIRAMNKGTTILTLICEADNSVQVEIAIIVK